MLKTLLRLLAVPAATLIVAQGCASAPPPPAQPAATASVSDAAQKANDEALKSQGSLLDKVVAVVNDQVILESELDQQVAQVVQEINQSNTSMPPMSVLRKRILDQMITLKLELQEAANDGITVSDDDVNQAVNRIAQRNGLTLSQLPEKLKEQGMDYADFRKRLRDQIIIEKVQSKIVQDQLNVTQREVDAQIKADQENGNADTQYHLSHILIATPLNPTPAQVAAARQKAQTIYEKLTHGADFATTAIATSDGQQALKGGDLGWRKQSELPTLFSDIVPAMKPGDVSKPIQSSSGFHIIKLDDVKRHDNKITVTQTHVRHILIKTNVLMTDAQAKAKLEELRKKIQAGADFAALAKEYSQDSGSAQNGGDLGWMDPGTVVPAFETVMNKTQVGQVSEPFKSQYGWHILQVLGRRKADQTQESLKNKAYEELYKRKSEQIVNDWLSQIRGSAYIKIYLGDGAGESPE